MKITIKELLLSQPSLQVIGSLKLNTAVKFRLGRIIKQVTDVLSEIEEQRVSLCKDNGGTKRQIALPNGIQEYWEFKEPDSEDKVNAEFKELTKVEVEIVFDKFTEESFEKLEFSSNDTANCLWLFKEPKPADAENSEGI